MPTRPLRTSGIIATLVALFLFAAPREAAAQFRVNGLAGVERIPARNAQAPSLVGVLRLEGSVSALPWFHLGAYGQALTDLSAGTSGSEFGGIASLRPSLPATPVDPLLFASIGYQRYPVGNGTLSGGWNAQLGAGLVLHANPFIDIEARASLLRMIDRDESALGGTGFVVLGGISIHP